MLTLPNLPPTSPTRPMPRSAASSRRRSPTLPKPATQSSTARARSCGRRPIAPDGRHAMSHDL